MNPNRSILFAVMVFSLACPARPDDSPQFRGPDRTGVSKETGLKQAWPTGGPRLLWKSTGLGEGHTTVSVAKGKIFGMGLVGEAESVWALDEKSGRRLWSTKIAGKTDLQGTQGGFGSRSTPTVDGAFLYVVGVGGDVVCLKTADGSVVWRKSLVTDFGGQVPTWGFSESPLVDGERLIVTPGGTNAVVALNKSTGTTIWKSEQSGTVAYSSAIAATVSGKKQYIQFLGGGVVGLSAVIGSPIWSYEAPANRQQISCSMPIYRDGLLFAATAYGTGGGLANVVSGQAEQVYFLREMQNHHGGMVLVGDYLYGTGVNSLMCVEFKTGKILWESRVPGKGSLAYADGMLYCRSERGPITLVEANPKEFLQRGQLLEQPDRSREPAWAYPVVANGKLYIHDQDVLLCYDIAGERK